MIAQHTSQRIRQLVAEGIKPQAVALMVHVSDSTVLRHSRGVPRPGREHTVKACEVCEARIHRRPRLSDEQWAGTRACSLSCAARLPRRKAVA